MAAVLASIIACPALAAAPMPQVRMPCMQVSPLNVVGS